MNIALQPRTLQPSTPADLDLSDEMAALWAALGPVPPERGRVVQFVSAASGEGASTIAREFAFLAARRAKKSVWLVDLDLFGGGQQKALAAHPKRYGPMGKAAAASPDGSSFFAVQPPQLGPEGRPRSPGSYFSARPLLGGKLWVTRFHSEAVAPEQSVAISRELRYWSALRAHADYIVIDAPAADRSTAALTLAPVADVNVMVVAAEAGDARGPAALRESLEAAGGKVAGLVFNRAQLRPPPFLQKLIR